MRQKCIERRHFICGISLETLGGTDQLFEILDPRFAALAFLLLKKLDQTAAVNDMVNLFLQVKTPRVPAPCVRSG